MDREKWQEGSEGKAQVKGERGGARRERGSGWASGVFRESAMSVLGLMIRCFGKQAKAAACQRELARGFRF